MIVVFFFSSRRRHTRCSRDWSSDVCSSDLRRLPVAVREDSDGWCAGLVICGRECSPPRRPDAECLKEIPRNHFALHKTGWAIAPQVESNIPAQRRYSGKLLLKRLKLLEHWIGKRAAVFRANGAVREC